MDIPQEKKTYKTSFALSEASTENHCSNVSGRKTLHTYPLGSVSHLFTGIKGSEVFLKIEGKKLKLLLTTMR